jgi:hypothetical protein
VAQTKINFLNRKQQLLQKLDTSPVGSDNSQRSTSYNDRLTFLKNKNAKATTNQEPQPATKRSNNFGPSPPKGKCMQT